MGIFEFFLLCLVVGAVVWAFDRWAPAPQQVKTLVLWVGVIFCVLVFLAAVGLIGKDYQIPRIFGR